MTQAGGHEARVTSRVTSRVTTGVTTFVTTRHQDSDSGLGFGATASWLAPLRGLQGLPTVPAPVAILVEELPLTTTKVITVVATTTVPAPIQVSR